MAEVTTTRQPSSTTNNCPQKAHLWLGQTMEANKKSDGQSSVLWRSHRRAKARREPGLLVTFAREFVRFWKLCSTSLTCQETSGPPAHPPSPLPSLIQQARPDPGWSCVYRARSGLQVVYGMKRYDAKQPNSAVWHPFTVWVILSSPLFLVVKGGTKNPWVLIKVKNEGDRKTEAKQELSGRNQTWAGEKQKLKRCESGWLRIGCSSATINLLKMCLQGNWPMHFRYG